MAGTPERAAVRCDPGCAARKPIAAARVEVK
jgi:hypothetical protein